MIQFIPSYGIEKRDTAEINKLIKAARDHYAENDQHPDSLSRLILQSSELINYREGKIVGLRFMAMVYNDLGQYEDAISNLTSALKLIKSDNYPDQILVFGEIAEVYRNLRNYDLTYEYLNKITVLLQKYPDPRKTAIYHNDLANYYTVLSDNDTTLYDSAWRHIKIAMDIYQKLNDSKFIAGCYNSMGMLDKNTGDYQGALEYFQKAIQKYQEAGFTKSLGSSYQNIAVSYWNLSQYDSAKYYYRIAMDYGKQYNLIRLNYASTKDLSALYSELNDFDSAYHYLVLSTNLERKIFNAAKLGVIREITSKYNYEKAAGEYNAQKRNYLIAGLFMLLILLTLVMRYSIVWRSRKKLRAEKQRSDSLLLNILPEKIAEELKATGKTEPQYFPNATILFADIVNFTKVSESLTATELINLLDDYFKHFDHQMKLHGLEKIKTIGDAYMAASGIPEANESHAINAVNAAITLQKEVRVLNTERILNGLPIVHFRIGIHSGSVIAGVVGQQKFQYDIWGDAVNMAARMEETSAAGMVNISALTYALVKNEQLIFKQRGKIHAKNKGEIEMYFVTSKEFSTNINEETLKYGNYTQFNKEFSLRLLEGLNKELTYHGYHHVQDVLQAARVIGESENLNDKEWELLNTAILLHDSGFLFGYDNHEERSCKLAGEILPGYGYSQEDIEIIQGMIWATKIPQQPKTIMEQIIADADLEYLGTDRFDEVSETLFLEWNNKDIMHDRELWNQTQVKFISAHTFFTDFCKENREWKKKLNLEKIKKLVNS